VRRAKYRYCDERKPSSPWYTGCGALLCYVLSCDRLSALIEGRNRVADCLGMSEFHLVETEYEIAVELTAERAVERCLVRYLTNLDADLTLFSVQTEKEEVVSAGGVDEILIG
jgi:hypothetical protein